VVPVLPENRILSTKYAFDALLVSTKSYVFDSNKLFFSLTGVMHGQRKSP
jgi:hypothetical protein